MRTLDDRFQFMDALDAHLKKLTHELCDLQRRIVLSNKVTVMEYRDRLNSLESRQEKIHACVEGLKRAPCEVYLADLDRLTDEVVDFGFELRSTADEMLRLTSSDWVFHVVPNLPHAPHSVYYPN